MKLSQSYEEEQKQLQVSISDLTEKLTKQQEDSLNISKFMARISKYTKLPELTVEIVNELIDKIVIHKPTGTKRNRIIQIDIYYNFIGKLNNEKKRAKRLGSLILTQITKLMGVRLAKKLGFFFAKNLFCDIIISNMKPNEDWNQVGQNQNFGAPNNYPQNPYPPQQNYGGFSNNFAQNGQFPSNQFPNEQFSNGQNPQQQFGGQNQNFGAQQNFPQYPNNYQNQQQFPVQPNQPVQNPQVAPKLMPDQNYSQDTTTENPYTVEYLNKIAPKKAAPFWTKGKILGASALLVSLFFSIFIIVTSNKGDDNAQVVVRAYYNISKLKETTKSFQNKIKSSDLAAVNAGINTSLSSNEQDLKEFMKSRKIEVPRGDSKKNSQAIKQTDAIFDKLSATLDDAFLNATIDEVYSREMAYQLIRVKDLITRRKKASPSSQKSVYEKIEKNLAESSRQLENYHKAK